MAHIPEVRDGHAREKEYSVERVVRDFEFWVRFWAIREVLLAQNDGLDRAIGGG